MPAELFADWLLSPFTAPSWKQQRDPGLGEQLALVDALRIGDARIRGRAPDQLPSRLGADVT